MWNLYRKKETLLKGHARTSIREALKRPTVANEELKQTTAQLRKPFDRTIIRCKLRKSDYYRTLKRKY